MDGIPTLRDGMLSSHLRTKSLSGGNPERVERIARGRKSSRGDEGEEHQSDSEAEAAWKVILIHQSSDAHNEHEENQNASGADPVEFSELKKAEERVYVERTDFVARTAASCGEVNAARKKEAFIRAHQQAMGIGPEFEAVGA